MSAQLCPHCGRAFDDDQRSALCPHEPLELPSKDECHCPIGVSGAIRHDLDCPKYGELGGEA